MQTRPWAGPSTQEVLSQAVRLGLPTLGAEKAGRTPYKHSPRHYSFLPGAATALAVKGRPPGNRNIQRPYQVSVKGLWSQREDKEVCVESNSTSSLRSC